MAQIWLKTHWGLFLFKTTIEALPWGSGVSFAENWIKSFLSPVIIQLQAPGRGFLTQGHVEQKLVALFQPSSWSEGSFSLIRDVTSLYWTLTSLSMSKHRYYFHLLLQNVICSSSVWMRTLQPTALYVTLYHFLLRYHIWTWHFWLLNEAEASVRAWLCCNAEWYYAYYYSKYCLLLRE